MANRRALSDEAVQELLDEVTLDIEGDVTVMGAEEGSPTDLLFHEVVDGGSPSHAPPSSPEEDDVVIDVDTSTMDFSVTPKKPHVLEEYMRDVDLSPVAGSSTFIIICFFYLFQVKYHLFHLHTEACVHIPMEGTGKQ